MPCASADSSIAGIQGIRKLKAAMTFFPKKSRQPDNSLLPLLNVESFAPNSRTFNHNHVNSRTDPLVALLGHGKRHPGFGANAIDDHDRRGLGGDADRADL